jgi:hypothetical protein
MEINKTVSTAVGATTGVVESYSGRLTSIDTSMYLRRLA